MPTINDNPGTPPNTKTTYTQTCPPAPRKAGMFSHHPGANSSARKRLDFTNTDNSQQNPPATPSLGS